MVTLWKILTDGKWCLGYRKVLNTKGYSVKGDEDVINRMMMHVLRLKDSPFAIE
ncbi:MAG: hypothetical protein LKF48_10590 [Prevotella sp.]|jgi:hypothetical protein|nr:hypothetical protein [Prevotella sp.]MCH4183590.1 hypothetical protein [Prevotella sp.]